MYPTWKYHKDLPGGKIVKNDREEMALGDGWHDSPADISAKKKATKEPLKELASKTAEEAI